MTQIFVGNLAYTTTERELRSVFEHYGRVSSVRLVLDRQTGNARGFAFIGMPRWDDILSPGDADAIHAYLIDLQGKTRADELAKQKAGKPLDGPSLTILSNY